MPVICLVENCSQPIANRKTKLCHKHHLRMIRHGTTDLFRKSVNKNINCKESGCDRIPQTLKGLCLKHYKSWKRKQPVDKSKRCSVCDNPVGVGSFKMCSKHYSQFRIHGDALRYEKRKCKPYGNKDRKYYKDEDGQWTHRRVAEEIIGRSLVKGEAVHHIDLDKLNNDPCNLVVVSESEHQILHRQLESVAGELVRDNLIKFENGRYYRCI